MRKHEGSRPSNTPAKRPADPGCAGRRRDFIIASSRRRDRGVYGRDRIAHWDRGVRKRSATWPPVLFVIGSLRTTRARQLTNNRADGGFDENHVMVAVSVPVLVVHANSHALAR
jgi:hypothetical protein